MVLPLKRDFFLAVALTSLVFITVSSIPMISILGAVLVPFPLMYYYSILGRAQGLLIFAVSLLIAILTLKVLGSRFDIAHFFLLGSVGPILSEVLRKNYSIEKTVIYSVSLVATLGGFILFYQSLAVGKAPWDFIEAYILELIKVNINYYTHLGVSSEQLELIRNNTEQISKVLTSLTPAAFLVGMSFFIWLNILIGKLLFRAKEMWYPDFGDLSTWKVPDRLIWVVILAGVSLLIPLQPLKILSINVIIVLLFAYLMQGLAIINFFFEKKNLPWFLRATGYFLIFAQQILLVVVVGLGLIDVWVNFRKLDRTK